MDVTEQILCQQFLLSLGTQSSFKRSVDIHKIQASIKSYQKHFKPYNPRKKGHNRYGLSITSLDGDFSGIPNLDSLYEYNKENGTRYGEGDFRQQTAFYKGCRELQDVMQSFNRFMGRSHILRLDKGGFFPPHRDFTGLVSSSFRIFIPLCYSSQYVFILDNKKLSFEPGYPYFFNTVAEHSLFAFNDESYFAVFNIDLCKESVIALKQSLSSR